MGEMRGFTQISNAALFDLTLTIGARVAYASLRHFAWEAGRRKETDGVRLPALDELAPKVGCSRTTLRSYVTELRRVGLVVAVGRGRSGMTYYIFDTQAASDAELAARKNRAESDHEKRRNLTRSPSRVKRGTKDDGKKRTPHSPPGLVDLELPPPIVKVGGRNLPVDAVCAACGIADGSPRVTQAVVAVNGRASRPGIRALFWDECRELAERERRTAELAALQADPERFAALLADRVARKARLIRERQSWRTSLTPAALLALWLDVELMTRSGGGLTPAEAARLSA